MPSRNMCICVCSFLKSKMNTWGLRTQLPYAIKNNTGLKEKTNWVQPYQIILTLKHVNFKLLTQHILSS